MNTESEIKGLEQVKELAAPESRTGVVVAKKVLEKKPASRASNTPGIAAKAQPNKALPSAVPATKIATAPVKKVVVAKTAAKTVVAATPKAAPKAAPKTVSKAVLKAPVKALTPAVTKTVVKAGAVKTPPQAKAIAQSAALKPAVAKQTAPHAVKEKAKKDKLVRDSFTMPEPEYAVLGQVKKACLAAGIEVKKSQLLRIGLLLLSHTDVKSLAKLIANLAPLKAGRPKKDK